MPVPLARFEPRPCPYLPDQTEQSHGFCAARLPSELYLAFLDCGFRRSGNVIYQPACDDCRECVSLRVDVRRFERSRSQRRCWRLNRDLVVRVDKPEFTEEKLDLYNRYCVDWHGHALPKPADELSEFLYSSPTDTVEFAYRDAAGALLGIGICDRFSTAISSVYFYFDPAHQRRRLGVFSALVELQYAKDNGLNWYYLGYWVRNSPQMRYKADYRPHELLGQDGVWRSGEVPAFTSPAGGPGLPEARS